MAGKHQDGKDAGEVRSITGKRKAQDSGEAMDMEDVLDIASSLGYNLRYNQVLNEIEMNGEPITDAIENEILFKLHKVGVENDNDLLKSMGWLRSAVAGTERYASYDPFEEYFQRCHYKYIDFAKANPGISMLKIFADALSVKTPEAAEKMGVDWKYECFKHWFCGAIAKIRCGFQNWMLVLQGKQGVGKSLLARKIGRVLGNRYFMAGPIDPRNKDHIIKRSTTLLWEAEELDGTMNFADMAHLKAFLTQDTAKERASYDRHARIFKNRCSFIGTVNTTEFLKDPTGNRRFLCMELLGIDKDLIMTMDMDLVWGEAVYLLENIIPSTDGHIDLPQEIIAIQNDTNEEVRVVSALETALDMRIVKSDKNMSGESVRVLIEMLNFPAFHFTQAKQYMERRGFKYGKSVRCEVHGKEIVTSGFKGCALG